MSVRIKYKCSSCNKDSFRKVGSPFELFSTCCEAPLIKVRERQRQQDMKAKQQLAQFYPQDRK